MRKFCRQPRKYLASIPLEYLVAIWITQRERIQVALGIVEILSRLRINTAHRPDHFRAEDDVVGRNDFEQKLDSRQVIDAGIEKNVLEQILAKQRTLQILCETAISAPV